MDCKFWTCPYQRENGTWRSVRNAWFPVRMESMWHFVWYTMFPAQRCSWDIKKLCQLLCQIMNKGETGWEELILYLSAVRKKLKLWPLLLVVPSSQCGIDRVFSVTFKQVTENPLYMWYANFLFRKKPSVKKYRSELHAFHILRSMLDSINNAWVLHFNTN